MFFLNRRGCFPRLQFRQHRLCARQNGGRHSREPRNRDIVAALIDGETTLKRFVVEQGRTYLKAENPRFPYLIPTRELVVQGVMVGLIRKQRN